MDCRVKPGNDDGWVRAALKSRTPLRFRGNDGSRLDNAHRTWTRAIVFVDFARFCATP